MRSRCWMAIMLCMGVVCARAQDSTLYVYGKVGNYMNGMPAWPFAVVAVDVKDTTYRSQARANAKGRYELVLHAGRLYVLAFHAEGLLPKHVLVDTRGPSAAQWKDGFGLQVDMALVPAVPGVDASVLNEPVGRCAFNLNSGNFEWDRAYADAMRPRLARLNAAVDKALMPDSLLGPPVVGPERPAPTAPGK
ncbi:MAG: hypothetical protein JNL05_03080 [Flavobacteriales bacterium]|nr:hypothetical protein [Flavobacteriales bacterium]